MTHYVIENPDKSLDIGPFLEETASKVVRLMDEHPNTKAQYLLEVWFRDDKEEVKEPVPFDKYLNSEQVHVRPVGQNWEAYSIISKRVNLAYQKVKLDRSHLTLDHIVSGTITFSEIDTQGAAGEYFSLPKWLAAKKALINIWGDEDACFKHSVARSLNIEDRHNTRLKPLLREKIAQLDWTGGEFPTPLEVESIRNFEKNNNIGVAIYTSEKNEERENVITKRSPSKRFGKVANIFLMSVPNGSEVSHHFCAITVFLLLLEEKEDKRVQAFVPTVLRGSITNTQEQVKRRIRSKKG